MKEYVFNNTKYVLEKDDGNIFDYEIMKDLVTPYFNNYDYIFGDLSYNKIRLKGFCDGKNKNKKKINDIKTLDNYILNYCAYGSKWFLLKKNNKNI